MKFSSSIYRRVCHWRGMTIVDDSVYLHIRFSFRLGIQMMLHDAVRASMPWDGKHKNKRNKRAGWEENWAKRKKLERRIPESQGRQKTNTPFACNQERCLFDMNCLTFCFSCLCCCPGMEREKDSDFGVGKALEEICGYFSLLDFFCSTSDWWLCCSELESFD